VKTEAGKAAVCEGQSGWASDHSSLSTVQEALYEKLVAALHNVGTHNVSAAFVQHHCHVAKRKEILKSALESSNNVRYFCVCSSSTTI
jgi:hypothetical protein